MSGPHPPSPSTWDLYMMGLAILCVLPSVPVAVCLPLFVLLMATAAACRCVHACTTFSVGCRLLSACCRRHCLSCCCARGAITAAAGCPHPPEVWGLAIRAPPSVVCCRLLSACCHRHCLSYLVLCCREPSLPPLVTKRCVGLAIRAPPSVLVAVCSLHTGRRHCLSYLLLCCREPSLPPLVAPTHPTQWRCGD